MFKIFKKSEEEQHEISRYQSIEAKLVFAFLLGILYMWILMIGFGGIISKDSYEEYRNIDRMKNAILSRFYNEVDEELLYDGMKKGLFSVLEDKYSSYLTPEALKSLLDSNEGVFFGYGLGSIEYEEDHILIGYVLDESPAKEAGIIAGDKIVSIDGKTVEYLGVEKSKEILLEDIEEGITIEILRGDDEQIEASMKKAVIEEKSVYPEMKDDILYIKLTQFISTTHDDFNAALENNPGYKALIIDVRNNSGGLLTEVLDVADRILSDGLITYTETKDGDKKEYRADSKESINVPIIVLTNKNSASASELLASALKENEVAVIYGDTTFGKGIVQETYRLPDGSGFKLTTRKYFTPLGNYIHEVGVEPNIKIEQDLGIELGTENDAQLSKAIEDISKLIE